MNRRLYILLIAFFSIVLVACQKEDASVEIPEAETGIESSEEGIGVEVPNLISEATNEMTRSSLALVSGDMKFSWGESDKIGVFNASVDHSVSTNMDFYFRKGTESYNAETKITIARFGNTSYSFSQEYYWVAYSPYKCVVSNNGRKKVADYSEIKLSYQGQNQIKNATPQGLSPNVSESGYNSNTEAVAASHLGNYDYMISDPTTPDDDGYVNFKFKHVGSTVRFYMRFPEGAFGGGNAKVKSLSLINKDSKLVNDVVLQIVKQPIPKETVLSPSYEEVEPISDKKKCSQELKLTFGENGSGIDMPDHGYLIAYMEFYPVEVSDKSCFLYITAEKDGKELYFRSKELPGKNIEAGYLYQWTTADFYTPIELTATLVPWQDVISNEINIDLEK